MSLVIKNLSYTHSDGTALYSDLSCTINKHDKIAVVGSNGVGKSTLIKQIVTRGIDQNSSIILDEPIFYIPQDISHLLDKTIVEVLQVADKIDALQQILAGSGEMSYFEILNDDWTVEDRIKALLERWKISYLDWNRKFSTLSGGERIKLLLAGIEINNASFVLLDEPTNHLDFETREMLYDWVSATKATLLIVSHDRSLLNLMNGIYELSSLGLKFYQGNYDIYQETKAEELNAIQGKLKSALQEQKATIQKQQQVAERRNRIESRGYAQSVKKGVGKLAIDYRQDRAEKVTAKAKGMFNSRLDQVQENIQNVRQQIATEQVLKMHLDSPSIIKGKELISFKEVNYGYVPSNFLWGEELSFTIRQGDRILLKGRNGSGKSTVLKLLTNQLQPIEGQVANKAKSILYLDQDYSIINRGLTVLEQAELYNNGLPEDEIRRLLSRSQLGVDYWDNKCSSLSGGEKMKLAFCCLQIAAVCPDLIILDEPTNNIDLKSIQILTKTIADYRGTMIVVSHDQSFVEEIGLTVEIELNRDKNSKENSMSNLIEISIPFSFDGVEQILNPMLIEEKDCLLLVDVPYPGQLYLLEQAFARVDKKLEDLTDIIITHHDIDHMGCLAEIKEKYPTIRVLTSVVEADYVSGRKKSLRLEKAESLFDSLPDEAKEGALAFQKSLESVVAVPVDVQLKDGEQVPNFKDLKVVLTPGHTPGHMSLLHIPSGLLIAGDALVVENGALNLANPHYTLDIAAAKRSIQSLLPLGLRSVYCYHGGALRGNINDALAQILK